MTDDIHRTLEGLELHLLATDATVALLDPGILDDFIPQAHRLSPTRESSLPLIEAIQSFNARRFAEPMQYPRWGLFDCAALPGFVLTLGTSDDLDATYVVVPRMRPGSWMVHPASRGANDAMVRAGFVLCLALCRPHDVLLSLRWGAPELCVGSVLPHADIVATHVPLDDQPDTCVLRCQFDRQEAPR